MKLRAHPVSTGQVRRGRSTELTALSMSNGLPGHAPVMDDTSLYQSKIPVIALIKANSDGYVGTEVSNKEACIWFSIPGKFSNLMKSLPR